MVSKQYEIQIIDNDELGDFTIPVIPETMFEEANELGGQLTDKSVQLNNIIISCPEDITNLMEFLLELKSVMNDDDIFSDEYMNELTEGMDEWMQRFS